MSIGKMDRFGINHNNGWVNGNLVMCGKQPFIVGDFIEVDEEFTINEWWCPVYVKTTGQYTGLKDKNGTEIYEGDIFALEVPYIDFVIGETIYEKEYIPVTYESGSYVLYEQGIQEHNLHDVLTGWRIKEGYKCSGVVVGNIHEHKHLLEAE